MLKIGKKNRNDSFKRAITIAEQGIDAFSYADQARCQIEAEQKRASARMYAQRNTYI